MTEVRRRVRIGGVTKAELFDRLQRAGVGINAIGLELFASEHFQTLDSASVVEAVEVTPADLGLGSGGVFAQIVEAAATRGLGLCALELGPHLRLAWLDQPEGTSGGEPTRHTAPPGSITVLSAPRSGCGDNLWGFYLRRIEGTPWLRGFRSGSGHVWQPEDVLVFTAARPAA